MKKILLLCLLFLSGCSCICPAYPVRVTSSEKGTNIYYDEEFIGSDSSYIVLRNKGIDKAKITGEKKGCKTTTLSPLYKFDWGVLNIIDLRNIARLLTGNVYIADTTKDLYNVTPRCN